MTSDQKPEFAARDLTLGQVNALVKKVGGPHEVSAFMRNDLKLIPNWRHWKEVTLGEHPTGWRYIDLIKRMRKMKITEYASSALEDKNFPCSELAELAFLVLTTPRELGFSSEPTFPKLCMRARQWGLERCRKEVGPALRSEYTDQFPSEVLNIASTAFLRSEEYLSEDEADPFIVVVQNIGDGPTLSARSVRSDHLINLEDKFIFEMIV